MDELKRIFPEETFVAESGEEVIVSPVSFGKLTVFSKTVTSLLAKIGEAGITKIENADDIGRVFSIAIEEVIALMGLVLGKNREWFDTITLADGVGLFTVILNQNFNEHTKKNLQSLATKIQSSLT
jgi:hypothetical protein